MVPSTSLRAGAARISDPIYTKGENGLLFAGRRVFASVGRKVGTGEVDSDGVLILPGGNGPHHDPSSQKGAGLPPAGNAAQNLDLQFRSQVEFAGDLDGATATADIVRERCFLERNSGAIGPANPHLQGYGKSVLAAIFHAHRGLGSPVGEGRF